VRIKFYWYEVFKNKKYGESALFYPGFIPSSHLHLCVAGRFSIHYEKAAVLFDIGVLYMKLAHNAPLQTQDGIKNACKFYRVQIPRYLVQDVCWIDLFACSWPLVLLIS